MPDAGMLLGNAVGLIDFRDAYLARQAERVLRDEEVDMAVRLGIVNSVMKHNAERFRPVLKELRKDPDLSAAIAAQL